MATISANRQLPVRLPSGGLTFRKLALAGYTNFSGGSTAHSVYHNSLVACDVSDTDGYFRAIATGVTWTSSDVFGGVAVEKQDVTSADTADGSKEITVAVDGVWGFPKNSLAITDMGAVVYAADETVFQSSSSAALAVGILVAVDATYAWVDISDYAGKVSSTTT